MTPEDQAALDAAGAAFNNAKTDAERVQAHADAEAIRAKYQYSGGADGSQKITTSRSEEEARQNSYIDVMNEANKVNNSGLAGAASDALMNSVAQQAPVPPVQQAPQVTMPNFTADIPDFTGLLDKWLESAKTQQQGAIDYATQKGVNDLQRAEEDAQEKFQTQQNQIDIDEAKAKDNQALYAEARGDRGGIGAAQYGQIQATAMQNRRAVNSARTKLSTDTARAIADLRAQGEFEKADKLLQLTQTFLGQLLELQQWGMEYSLNVAQFNAQLQQWQAEFNMQAQQYADSLSQWQTEFSYTVSQNAKEQLAKSGLAALSVGIRPSKSQQEAMGYTDEQIDASIAQYELAQKMGTGSGKGGSGGNPVTGIEPVGGDGLTGVLVEMFKAGKLDYDEAYHYLRYNKKYSEGDSAQFAELYLASLEDGSLERTANNAPQVDLSDIPGWVLADLKERLVGIDRADKTAVGLTTMNHLNTLIDKKIITEDQAYRIGASIGLPY